MKRAFVWTIVIAACGGGKTKPAQAPALRPAQQGTGTTDRRVYDFSGETLARDAADAPDAPDANGAPGAAPSAVDKAGIRGELQRHRGTLAACLEKDAAAKGQLELVFGIAASGAIGDVYVNGVGNDELKACMSAAVKTFAFAADPGGVLTEVHYPLTIP